VGARADLDGRKISSQPEFDPGPSSPKSVGTPNELPGPLKVWSTFTKRVPQLSQKSRKYYTQIYFNILSNS